MVPIRLSLDCIADKRPIACSRWTNVLRLSPLWPLQLVEDARVSGPTRRVTAPIKLDHPELEYLLTQSPNSMGSSADGGPSTLECQRASERQVPGQYPHPMLVPSLRWDCI